MRVSNAWLREFCDPKISCEQIAQQLTMAGLEVESIDVPEMDFSQIIIAKVVATEKHPNADKLTVCQIDAGQSELLQVICGAANVREGLKVVLAQVGTKFPTMTIKKAKLRGVVSNGMLCSETELGLAEQSEGIMELPADAPVGTPIADYLNLQDAVIDLSITPNRGDCASILGVAREVSALSESPLVMPPIAAVAASQPASLRVNVNDITVCPHYYCQEIDGVDGSLESPIWLQQRLRQSGVRPVSGVVDILNYVMLALGQPMHAFDRASFDDQICVRLAKEGERLCLLDDTEVTLHSEDLVVANSHKVVALAGVMGGKASGVTEHTTGVVIESAHFVPEVIARCVRRLGIHSDASYRFERGVDPTAPQKALQWASTLICELLGGSAREVVSVETPHSEVAPIRLRRDKLASVLGVAIDDQEVLSILTRLSMAVTMHSSGWDVIPPRYRFDVQIEQDLIEEVARLHGYHSIPEVPGAHQAVVSQTLATPQLLMQARVHLSSLGYNEAITYSFVSEQRQAQLLGERPVVRLSNPISAEMNVMRLSHWVSLLQAVSHNQNRQQPRVRLFELGNSYLSNTAGDTVERRQLSGVAFGDALPEQWALPAREADFFDVKAEVVSLLSLFVPASSIQFEAIANHPALHPGQAATISLNDKVIGLIGTIHPQQMKSFGLKQAAVLFEIDIDEIIQPRQVDYRPISKFPTARRDYALLVHRDIPADSLLRHANELPGVGEVTVALFDVYEGEGVPEDKKSVAISMTFSSADQTLTDEAVAKQAEKVLNSLIETYAVELRE